MGSLLGPLFANIFLAFHEGSWSPEFKPLFFRRYVDDCFVFRHPNIKFSFELETNSKLPFLDVLIDRSDGSTTSVYRKPTFTSLFTLFSTDISKSAPLITSSTPKYLNSKTFFLTMANPRHF